MREFAKAFYRSKEWLAVRSYVLMRDRYLCTRCGAPADVVHHKVRLTPENLYDQKVSLDPENLESLCSDCHYREHRGEHGGGRVREEAYPYEFDETGKLVRKASPR